MTCDQSLRGGTVGAVISNISLRIVSDILGYTQRTTIQQVSSLHLFSFPAVSCLIFEMEWGSVEIQIYKTLECIRLNVDSSVLCLLVHVLQCKPMTNLSFGSLLIGNVWIKLQAINEDLQCDRLTHKVHAAVRGETLPTSSPYVNVSTHYYPIVSIHISNRFYTKLKSIRYIVHLSSFGFKKTLLLFRVDNKPMQHSVDTKDTHDLYRNDLISKRP